MNLPNFLIIGGVRCGTTSLYKYLLQHEDVFMPAKKEPDYFAWMDEPAPEYFKTAVTNFLDYSALFDEAEQQAIGEASAIYLYKADVTVDRIAALLPDVKLIAILRHPADRAFSQYRMSVRVGAETLPTFREALMVEDERVEEGASPIFHYRRQSLYYPKLARFTERFMRDRLFLLTFDEFVADTAGVVRRIFDFLDVDPRFTPNVERIYNATRAQPASLPRRMERKMRVLFGRTRRESPELRIRRRRLKAVEDKLKPAVREELIEYFRPDVQATSELLSRDLSYWLR